MCKPCALHVHVHSLYNDCNMLQCTCMLIWYCMFNIIVHQWCIYNIQYVQYYIVVNLVDYYNYVIIITIYYYLFDYVMYITMIVHVQWCIKRTLLQWMCEFIIIWSYL